MKSIHAIWKNGQIVPTQPVDWPGRDRTGGRADRRTARDRFPGRPPRRRPAVHRPLARLARLARTPAIHRGRGGRAAIRTATAARLGRRPDSTNEPSDLRGNSMRRYLLDTGAVGNLINRRKGVDQRTRTARLAGAAVGTCIPVVGELFFGQSLRHPGRGHRARPGRVHRCQRGYRPICRARLEHRELDIMSNRVQQPVSGPADRLP